MSDIIDQAEGVVAGAEFTEIKTNIDMLCRLAMGIPLEDARRLVNELERTDAVMPIVDPTAYLRVRHNIPGHKEAANAFLAFRLRLEKLVEVRE